MSTFFGKIEKLIPFKGRIGRKPTGLKVEIQPVNELQGELQPVKGLRGSIAAKHRFTGTGIRPLAAIYRFLSAASRFTIKHKAKVATAPAQELKVEKPVTLVTKAKLVKHSTADLKVNQSIRMTVTARLVAYARAPAEYIKKLFIPSDAKLIAAPGKTAEHIRTLDFVRKSEMVSAEAKTAKAVGSLTLVKKAECIEAPTQSSRVGSVMAINHEAKAGTGASLPLMVTQAVANIQVTASLGIAMSVTFLTHELKELGWLPVRTGEDCADPIASGVFQEPTRESDAQYHYTAFAGWSLTNGGDADASALLAVTEPRQVFAAFEKELRNYNIYFYDSDGETLLETLLVPYGAIPEPTAPTKSGYVFDSWSPELVAVTGEATYRAQWADIPSFADASWTVLNEIAASGKASEYFAVGDERTEIISGYGQVKMAIAGFNHDDLADGSGKAAMTIVLTTVLPASSFYFAVSKGETWLNCDLRTKLNTVYSAIYSEWQGVIKSVKKKYTDGTSSKNIKTCTDKLFALARIELNPTGSGTPDAEGETYELYATKGLRKLTTYGSTTARTYSLRSNASYNRYWTNINTSGTVAAAGSTTVYIHFGFCI